MKIYAIIKYDLTKLAIDDIVGVYTDKTLAKKDVDLLNDSVIDSEEFDYRIRSMPVNRKVSDD